MQQIGTKIASTNEEDALLKWKWKKRGGVI